MLFRSDPASGSKSPPAGECQPVRQALAERSRTPSSRAQKRTARTRDIRQRAKVDWTPSLRLLRLRKSSTKLSRRCHTGWGTDVLPHWKYGNLRNQVTDQLLAEAHIYWGLKRLMALSRLIDNFAFSPSTYRDLQKSCIAVWVLKPRQAFSNAAPATGHACGQLSRDNTRSD